VPRRNRSKGLRKREAYERRLAERELRELERELHTEQCSRADDANTDHNGDTPSEDD